jgi:diacylglycerol kinase (ATP)
MGAPVITVIMNPSAHSERAQRSLDAIQRLAAGADLRFTTGQGDARRMSAEAARAGAEVVVACGGDGTVSEVANGLAGTNTALGVVPIGTMNVFSKELGIPAELGAAWAVIERGLVREIDLPEANGAHFIQLAGVGLDAQVVKETSWESKKRLGPLSYIFSAAQIAARTPPLLRVETDEAVREGSFVLIGNGRFYGAKLVLFPNARPDDGKLDVLVFKNLGYLDIARYVGGVLIGHHTDLADVEYFQASELRVTSDEPVPVELDGELFGDVPVTFRMCARLRVCAPLK